MPYFIICPIYAAIFVGLLLLAGVLAFTKQFRRWSSYLVAGALGTLPGFIVGNVMFWLAAIGVMAVLRKPLDLVESELGSGTATVGLILFLGGGLVFANIAFCALGFMGGFWLRSKFRRPSPPRDAPSPTPSLPNPHPPA